MAKNVVKIRITTVDIKTYTAVVKVPSTFTDFRALGEKLEEGLDEESWRVVRCGSNYDAEATDCEPDFKLNKHGMLEDLGH